MARQYEDFTRRGATLAAISVDPPPVSAAMVEKLAIPFPLLSDPDGSGAIKPYDLWNAAQSIAKPAIIVFAPDGREVYHYAGIDFMDRPNDDDILNALDELKLPPLPAAEGPVPHVEPQPGPRAMPLDSLGLYMRAVRAATGTLAERLRDPADKAEVQRTSAMAERFIKAQAATQRMRQGQ